MTSDDIFGVDPKVMADLDDDRVYESLEAAVWRAIATKVAHESEQAESLLRSVCREIRDMGRQQKTVVVPIDFPYDYDFGFPAAIIRSQFCPAGTAYVLPAEAELEDLLLDHEVSLD